MTVIYSISHNENKESIAQFIVDLFVLEMSRRLRFSCFWTFRENQQRTAIRSFSEFLFHESLIRIYRATSKEKNIGEARVDNQNIDLKLDLWGLQWLTTSLRYWMSFSLIFVNLQSKQWFSDSHSVVTQIICVMMSVRCGDSNLFIVWLTIYWYGSKSIGPSVRLHHLAAN